MDKWEVEQLQIKLDRLIEGYTSKGLYIQELQQRINKAIEYIKQYEEIYYPDEPLSEPVITYNIGVYEEDFDEAKLLDILRGEE